MPFEGASPLQVRTYWREGVVGKGSGLEGRKLRPGVYRLRVLDGPVRRRWPTSFQSPRVQVFVKVTGKAASEVAPAVFHVCRRHGNLCPPPDEGECLFEEVLRTVPRWSSVVRFVDGSRFDVCLYARSRGRTARVAKKPPVPADCDFVVMVFGQ